MGLSSLKDDKYAQMKIGILINVYHSGRMTEVHLVNTRAEPVFAATMT